MPQIASGENTLKRSATAPTSFPSIYTGLPLIPAATLVSLAFPPIFARMTSCCGPSCPFQHADDFDRHRLGLHAWEHGPGHPVHPRLHVFETERSRLCRPWGVRVQRLDLTRTQGALRLRKPPIAGSWKGTTSTSSYMSRTQVRAAPASGSDSFMKASYHSSSSLFMLFGRAKRGASSQPRRYNMNEFECKGALIAES